MNEQENERIAGAGRDVESLPVLGRSTEGPGRRTGDLVVDLSGFKKLDLTSLALLLTAQRQAREEDREVWLAGVPVRIWEALENMGLGGLFKAFPVSGQAMI